MRPRQGVRVTPAEITAQLTALYAVRGTGAKSTTHAGKTLVFHSPAELDRIIAGLERQLISPRRPPSGLAQGSNFG